MTSRECGHRWDGDGRGIHNHTCARRPHRGDHICVCGEAEREATDVSDAPDPTTDTRYGAERNA